MVTLKPIKTETLSVLLYHKYRLQRTNWIELIKPYIPFEYLLKSTDDFIDILRSTRTDKIKVILKNVYAWAPHGPTFEITKKYPI